MADLHQRFMGIPGPTDVLTFELDHDARGRTVAGEVVVCVPYALRQARRRRIAPRDELLLYALHGMLHLGGYDDRTPADFARMHRREDQILGADGRRPRLRRPQPPRRPLPAQARRRRPPHPDRPAPEAPAHGALLIFGILLCVGGSLFFRCSTTRCGPRAPAPGLARRPRPLPPPRPDPRPRRRADPRHRHGRLVANVVHPPRPPPHPRELGRGVVVATTLGDRRHRRGLHALLGRRPPRPRPHARPPRSSALRQPPARLPRPPPPVHQGHARRRRDSSASSPAASATPSPSKSSRRSSRSSRKAKRKASSTSRSGR